MEKDKWTAEVLNSTAGIRKVAPRDGLLDDIMQAVQTSRVSAGVVWIAAASIVALVVLNLAVIKQEGQSTGAGSGADSVFYTNNQLY